MDHNAGKSSDAPVGMIVGGPVAAVAVAAGVVLKCKSGSDDGGEDEDGVDGGADMGQPLTLESAGQHLTQELYTPTPSGLSDGGGGGARHLAVLQEWSAAVTPPPDDSIEENELLH